MPRVDMTIVLDFMCPWSFIGMRSLRLAKENFRGSLEFSPIEFIPFEFDPPGTYPPEGLDWTKYCQGYGPAKAQFLLTQKLPSAFALGKAVGIDFRMERRIVHTVDVNAALELAQRHGVGLEFVEETLSQHFEYLENPNDAEALRSRLANLGIPKDEVEAALSDPGRQDRNIKRTEAARALLRGGGVPNFQLRCDGGEDLCQSAEGGPTSPAYFERLFSECLRTC